MEEINDIVHMTLDGGESCFDFINSGYNDKEDIITERLHSFEDIIILAERLSLLSEKRLMQLRNTAAEKPEQALKALNNAKKVRLVMYNVFKSIAKTGIASINLNSLNEFNTYLFNALSKQALVIEEGKLVPAIDGDTPDLNVPLWAFLISAYNVLRDKDQQRIKQCNACEWLFIDYTKNNTRKWCDMQSCGSLEKSRRYYQRKKKAKSGS